MKQKLRTRAIIIMCLYLSFTPFICGLSVQAEKPKTTEATTEKKDDTTSTNGIMHCAHFQQWGSTNGKTIGESACTRLTEQHIAQASGVIADAKYQMPFGNYYNADQTIDGGITWQEWQDYSSSFENSCNIPGNSMAVGGMDAMISGLSDGKVHATEVADKLSGGESSSTGLKGVWKYGDKELIDMSYDEVKEVFKMVWSAGYWCAVAVRYTDSPKNNNSLDNGVYANHWIAFSGFADDGEVYIYDSGSGTYEKDYNVKLSTLMSEGHQYKVAYLVLWEFSNGKMMTTLNGKNVTADTSKLSGTNASNTDAQMNLVTANGYYSESALMAYCRVAEVNIDETLDQATINNLTQGEAYSLDTWIDDIEKRNENKTIRGILRKGIALVAILMTVWAILFYCAYWIDRYNSFIDIEFVGLLSFGKFMLSEDEAESTYTLSDGKSKQKKVTIRHADVLKICLSCIVFAVLILTGYIYKLVYAIAYWVNKLLGRL